MNRIAFAEDNSCFSEEVRLYGVGWREIMPPGSVSRRCGLSAYLLVLFHDAVDVELGGERKRIAANTMVLWDRFRPHLFGDALAPWSHSWVVFCGSAWNEECALWRPLFEVPRHFADPAPVEAGFKRLLREFTEMQRPHLPILVSNIRLLIQEMARDQADGPGGAFTSDPVRKACRWISANLQQRMTVADVARYAGLSAPRLQQLFNQRLGCSLQVWIERERLREVRYWLMHSGLKIGEIAERTGFADGLYLSRRFAKAHGQSPTAYRKIHFGEQPAVDTLPKSN
jgi:AraC-like DNA-binding protein